ncbi:MAG: transporter, family, 3-phenylpropionic acid transporter [Betaproteobacteria bacterium]|nr:transporter, family, 3-phenylpropionic acid transporter [Betaproteobacteria bacterium]
MPPLIPLASFYFAYFAYAGIGMAFLPLYFASRGLQAGEIAFLVALPYIARTFAPAAWGWLADATGGRRGIVVFSCAAGAACFLVIPHVSGVAAIAALVAALALLSAGAVPIVEAITLGSLAGQMGRYGPIRVWGSVGFMLATFGGGAWLDYWPATTLPPLLVALSLAALIVSLALPAAPQRMSPGGDAPRISGGVGTLLAAGFCMSAAHGTLYTFFTLYLEREGHSGMAIGGLWTLGVLAEIVVFLALPALFRRHSLSTILLASFACAVARFLAIGWLPASLWILVPAQLLHAASFGAFHAASVAAVHRLFPESAQARGQTLFSSLSYGAGGAAGALVAGWTWQASGPALAFSASAAVAVAGACFAYRLRRFGL